MFNLIEIKYEEDTHKCEDASGGEALQKPLLTPWL
jgi:hypothetical protein